MKNEFGAMLLVSAVMFSGCSPDNEGDRAQKQHSSEQQVTQEEITDATFIGASEGNEVKLYKATNGVKLNMNGKAKDFQWANPGDTGTDPQVFYTDVTGDEEKEAVIILCTARGTGLSMFDIHVVDKDLQEMKFPNYKEIVAEYIASNVVKKDANTLGITVKVQGKEQNFDFEFADFGFDPQPDLKLEQDELAFGGQITYFLEKQKIKLNLTGSVAIYPSPTYVIDFTITYAFDDKKNEFIVDQIDVKPVEYKKE
ncbi:hypothetical protein MHB44_01815 [Lysinibacillus sp. FSL H8-0500]|uniref:hypothetical protein n=1 Tax=Lysinibacillus sp. FSL H8-0500 TaxID=2921393 RepID=UPI0031016F91